MSYASQIAIGQKTGQKIDQIGGNIFEMSILEVI